MNLTIQKCIYYCKNDDTTWEFSYSDADAIITKKVGNKNVKKKLLDKEYLKNLDVFFRISEMEKWESSDIKKSKEDFVLVVTCDKEYFLTRSQSIILKEESIYDDLHRYFEFCFDEKIKPTVLSFHSFDGGGPVFDLKMEVSDIFTWCSKRNYYKEDHENLCGAGYDVVYTFYPLRVGVGVATITGFSPICFEPKRKITIEIDENFNMKEKVEIVK